MKIKKALRKFMLAICAVSVINILNIQETKAGGDGFTSAQQINVNTEVSDNLTDAGDADYFRFTLEQEGVAELSFEHEELENSNSLWTIILYNEDREELYEFNVRGSKTLTESCQIGLPAGNFYVKIEGFGIVVGDNWSDTMYQLTVKYSDENDWEREFNDGFTSADPLTIGKTINGCIMEQTEIDYFKVEVKRDGAYVLSFSHKELESSSNLWEINMYDENRNCGDAVYSKGSQKKTLETGYLEAGTYYISVEGGYTLGNNWSDVNYKLKLTPYVYKETISSLNSAKKNTLSVKWDQGYYVDGYEVVLARDAKFKSGKQTLSVNDGTKVKKTVKGLKSKKTYYVKVRAYKVVDGKTYYGAYSNAKKIKIK